MISSLAQLESMSEEELLLERLEEGAGRRCLFLPFVGEFGHEVMSHVRIVHFNRASEKTVCCRPGCEVLYPSATHYVTNWNDSVADAARVGTMRSRRVDWPELTARFPSHQTIRAGRLSPAQEVMVIRPGERVPFSPRRRGFNVDVVLGVRRREFAPERNWAHWQRLADTLRAARLTFAVIGDRVTSCELNGQALHSGNVDTDAAVELLQTCRLFIGTDSGSSHLAAAVGASMLIFRETQSGSRDLVPRMAEINTGRVAVVEDGWHRPEIVAAKALAMLGATRCH